MKLKQLETALGYAFQQPALLRQSLTHRSYSAEHNERLEFLGDSVLNCVIAGLLFRNYPKLKEGDLSRFRASLVRQESLAEVARTLGLGGCLLLGEGEMKSGGAQRASALADALEAVIGAILLDGGFDAARDVTERLYQEQVARIDPTSTGKDAKTVLQELLQGRHLPLPRYALLRTRGEAHQQEFDVECCVPDLDVKSEGVGNSRRMAEQRAAEQVIAAINAQAR
jgi:ribonuclease-3